MTSTAPLDAWPQLRGLPVSPLAGGLINESFAAGSPPRACVQRLNPIFHPRVHEDIEAVTAHLAARGMPGPRLLRTAEGGLYTLDAEGACWRALSWVEGQTWSKLQHPRQAAAAGALVARWHVATADLDHAWVHLRPLAHDTPHHLAALAQALARHPDHRLYDAVAPLAEALRAAWAAWDGDLHAPRRPAHGDLKISNLRFSAEGEGICLLDLDTMGPLALDVELGDAWRSWCNPAAEDSVEARFDLGLFEASARAYLAVNPLGAEDRERLPAGVERICLELAMRFCADALNESYFGWSPAVAPTRGEHNLLRARGQLALARSVRAARGAMQAALAGA